MSCQQFELYAAEGSVPAGRPLTADELQAYVDELRESPWFKRNFPKVRRIEAYLRRSNADSSVGKWLAGQNAGIVEMLPCHLTELFVLHEVCHVLAEARYGSRSHDPWFARTYLEAVSTYMEPEVYPKLYDAFSRAGIDFEHDSSALGGIPL